MSDTCSLFPVCGPLAFLTLTLSLVPSQTSPVACASTWPCMWHDRLLDLHRIVNNHQLFIMISEQDEVLLSYMIDLKVSEGEWQVGELGREVGDHFMWCEHLEWRSRSRWYLPWRQATDPRNLHISPPPGPGRCRNWGIPGPAARC